MALIAAVPKYLGTDFEHASPAMRFGMYLALWNNTDWSKTKENPLAGVTKLYDDDKKTMRALLARQRNDFDSAAASGATFCLPAVATAPFTTGLGNEHPTENGFAFLSPYGLPYLPGSGVKGVLRQAARELASGEWGDSKGWSGDKSFPLETNNDKLLLSVIDALFGLENEDGDQQHVRGALSFWDVIPQLKGDRLAVDIMTPHYSHYYQQKNEPKSGGSVSPHDSGQPNPIHFLTVPPGSAFTFHVVCDCAHLYRFAPALLDTGEGGQARWKSLLAAAFEHAFEWLGFGAKTAVGYGAMTIDSRMQEEFSRTAQARLDAERKKSMSAEELTLEEFRKRLDHDRSGYKVCLGKGLSSPLGEPLRQFVLSAASWHGAYRTAARELLAEVFAYLDVNRKKNDKAKDLWQRLADVD